jgi:hypothetical protein
MDQFREYPAAQTIIVVALLAWRLMDAYLPLLALRRRSRRRRFVGRAGTYRRTGPLIVITTDVPSGTPEVIKGIIDSRTLTLQYDLEHLFSAAEGDDERLVWRFVRSFEFDPFTT